MYGRNEKEESKIRDKTNPEKWEEVEKLKFYL